MDVKPDNVIVVNGRPVLFDFGSMREKTAPRPPNVDGTDPYIAPEELLLENSGQAADVFALGVTLYEMLTGKLPFPERKIDGLLAQASRPPERLSRHRPKVRKKLEEIVLSCLARKPENRPSIRKLLPALHEFIQDGPLMWPSDFQAGKTTAAGRQIQLPNVAPLAALANAYS